MLSLVVWLEPKIRNRQVNLFFILLRRCFLTLLTVISTLFAGGERSGASWNTTAAKSYSQLQEHHRRTLTWKSEPFWGGESGQLLIVDSLEDHGPGTLRTALATRGPRIIRFQVGGVILLESPLQVRNNGRVKIDGWSAVHHGGITLQEFGLEFFHCDDVVVTNLRQRRARQDRGGDGNGLDLDSCRRVLIDHCSISWATDENLGAKRAVDVTFQWCLVAEGLIEGGHREGSHSCGALLHRAHRVSMHHCFFTGNLRRNPLWSGNYTIPDVPGEKAWRDELDEGKGRVHPLFDIRNNLFYNYVAGGATLGGAFSNFIGNTYRPGPSTPPNAVELRILEFEDRYGHGRLYLKDNAGPGLGDDPDEWSITQFRGLVLPDEVMKMRVEQAFPAPVIKTQSAGRAADLVLEQAGAWPRDATDLRLVQEAKQGGGRAGIRPTE